MELPAEDDQTTGVDGRENDDDPLGEHELLEEEPNDGTENVGRVCLLEQIVRLVNCVGRAVAQVGDRQIDDQSLARVPLPKWDSSLELGLLKLVGVGLVMLGHCRLHLVPLDRPGAPRAEHAHVDDQEDPDDRGSAEAEQGR